MIDISCNCAAMALQWLGMFEPMLSLPDHCAGRLLWTTFTVKISQVKYQPCAGQIHLPRKSV